MSLVQDQVFLKKTLIKLLNKLKRPIQEDYMKKLNNADITTLDLIVEDILRWSP